MKTRTLSLAMLSAVAAISACSSASKTERYQIDPAPAARSMPDKIGSAVLREVSLPQYAADQEIAFQTADGAVRTDARQVWADDPRRAVTLALASQISEVSGARVIAEPWPLSTPPARQIEVRVDRMLAAADNTVRLSGSYYVSGDSGDTVRRFDIAEPIQGSGPAAIAAAQSRAVATLARQIAALG